MFYILRYLLEFISTILSFWSAHHTIFGKNTAMIVAEKQWPAYLQKMEYVVENPSGLFHMKKTTGSASIVVRPNKIVRVTAAPINSCYFS